MAARTTQVSLLSVQSRPCVADAGLRCSVCLLQVRAVLVASYAASDGELTELSARCSASYQLQCLAGP